MEVIEVTAYFCHPYMNFGGDGCNEIVLKYPPEQAAKLYQAVISNGDFDQSHDVDYTQYLEFWSLSFFITLTFWLLAKSYGLVLSFIRNS